MEYLPNLVQVEANSRERAPPTGQTQRAGERAVRTHLVTLVLAKKRDAKIMNQSSNKGTDLKLTGEPYSKSLILRAGGSHSTRNNPTFYSEIKGG